MASRSTDWLELRDDGVRRARCNELEFPARFSLTSDRDLGYRRTAPEQLDPLYGQTRLGLGGSSGAYFRLSHASTANVPPTSQARGRHDSQVLISLSCLSRIHLPSDSATIPAVEEQLVFNDPHGHRVSAILTVPGRGTGRIAVLCHGFLSGKNSTTNKTLTRMLTNRGIATFRFDFVGQGDSDGPFEEITTTLAMHQTEAALDLVSARGYGQIGLVGSSFGGLVAILTAARRRDIDCLALKCP